MSTVLCRSRAGRPLTSLALVPAPPELRVLRDGPCLDAAARPGAAGLSLGANHSLMSLCAGSEADVLLRVLRCMTPGMPPVLRAMPVPVAASTSCAPRLPLPLPLGSPCLRLSS